MTLQFAFHPVATEEKLRLNYNNNENIIELRKAGVCSLLNGQSKAVGT